jgi:Na+/pantothenate symporter
VVTLTIFSGSVYAACFFPALIFGLHWRRGSGRAVVASILTGLAVLAIWITTDLDQVVHEVFPALALSMAVFVVVARLTPPNNDPRIQRAFTDQAIADADE